MKQELSRIFKGIITNLIKQVNKGNEVLLFGNVILGKDNRVKLLSRISDYEINILDGYVELNSVNIRSGSKKVLPINTKISKKASKVSHKKMRYSLEKLFIHDDYYVKIAEKNTSETDCARK